MKRGMSDQQAFQAWEQHGRSFRKAAAAIGIDRNDFRDKVRRHMRGEPQQTHSEERLHTTTAGDENHTTITADGVRAPNQIKALEEVLKESNVDQTIWKVDRYEITKWEVGRKAKTVGLDYTDGRADGSVNDTGAIHVQPLWRVKVCLKRILPKVQEDAFAMMVERLKAYSPTFPKFPAVPKAKNPHLLEVSIFDAHFGKLCWAMETGQNYDVRIAEHVYLNAVQDLASKAAGMPIDRILFPFGSDFFNINGSDMQTQAGTRQDNDGRYARIIDLGYVAVSKAIEYLATLAPVDVLWVPGNHDYATSLHLARELWIHFRNTDRVTVDIGDYTPQKKYRYGVNLIGFTHGDKERHDGLPLNMADLWPQDWADTKVHEWHLGHYHQERETKYNSARAIGSVTIRVLPSISGTDYFHRSHGYVGGHRAAEAHVYSKDGGRVGYFVSDADGITTKAA